TEVNITSIGIVPLGIPLLAGPGAIVTTIVDATALPGAAHKIAVSVVIVLTAIVVYVALRLSAKAGPYMRPTPLPSLHAGTGLPAGFPILTQGHGKACRRLFPRHGRTWSDHPRVSRGKTALGQANSWMVVPSTTMTG